MSRVPKYRKHTRGYAFVQHSSIPTKDHRLYLGKHGSPESRQKYAAFIESLDGDGTSILPQNVATVEEVVAHYCVHARKHYARGEGMAKEFETIKYSLKTLLKCHGKLPANKFGPRALIEVRNQFLETKCRATANHDISRIKRVFRWACEQELIPAEIYQRLQCVRGLYRGQDGAKEREPVRPADIASVFAVLPYLSPTVAAMVQIQFYGAMRPEEVCQMRGCEIDRSGDPWFYRPADHKTRWRGHDLTKVIPQLARPILTEWLRDDPEDVLFCVQDARAWGRAQQTDSPGASYKRLRERLTRSGRTPYSTSSYRQALQYGFNRATRGGIVLAPFKPNQIRHAALTWISQQLGQQAAQRWAGHASLNTTGIYVERQTSELRDIAAKLDALWQQHQTQAEATPPKQEL